MEATNLWCTADTALFEGSPNNNLGGSMFLPIGRSDIGSRGRGLFRFDLAGRIPAEAIILSAQLELEVVFRNPAGVDISVSAHRCLRAWGEGNKSGGDLDSDILGAAAETGEATWNACFYPQTLWSEAGGTAVLDYTGAASASANITATGRYSFRSPSLTGDVRQWVRKPGTNFGWMVKVDNEMFTGTAMGFGAREDAMAAPRLIVEYEVLSRPILENSRLSGSQYQFHFLAESNRSYVVEYSTTLMDPWLPLTVVPPDSNARTIFVSDTVTAYPRFYRVVIR